MFGLFACCFIQLLFVVVVVVRRDVLAFGVVDVCSCWSVVMACSYCCYVWLLFAACLRFWGCFWLWFVVCVCSSLLAYLFNEVVCCFCYVFVILLGVGTLVVPMMVVVAGGWCWLMFLSSV